MNNYHSRYGLEFNPFIKNTKEIIMESSEYKEVIGRLNYLVQNKGFGLLSGSPGKGKTTIVRSWSNTLNPSLYKVVYISLSTLTIMEFYRNLADHLGVLPAHRKTENFKLIQEAIKRYANDKKITPVIILDEANYMKNGVLNDIKMLFNFDMDSRDKAVVIFVGLPQLNNMMRLSIHEPLRQRITMNYHLEGFQKQEMKNYIHKRIEGAGGTQEVFNEKALEAICNASNGVARVANNICNASLIIADKLDAHMIDEEIIMKAVNENELE